MLDVQMQPRPSLLQINEYSLLKEAFFVRVPKMMGLAGNIGSVNPYEIVTLQNMR